MNLTALGENGLLDLLTHRWQPSPRTRIGVGDDCAVLRGPNKHQALLFKTDAVVEDVHFTRKTPGRLVGRKALARALSDIAAMGGIPRAAVITLGLPRNYSLRRVQEIYRGLEQLARTWKVDLVGGETTRAPSLFLNVALLGDTRGYAPVLRSTARPGDWIWVTGKLGGTQKRHHLTFTPRLAEGAWLARKGVASAMMDLSDGMAADLPRLARQSRVAIQLFQKAIPRRAGASLTAALSDGEDYELLFTTSAKTGSAFKKRWPFRTPLTWIGQVVARSATSPNVTPQISGYDHFQSR